MLNQVIADHLRAGLGQHPILIRIADFHGGGYDGQTEFVLLQEFPGLVQRLFILKFCIGGFVENLLGVVAKFLAATLRRQSGNPVLSEFGRIFVTALFEEAAQQEILLQGIRIFSERGHRSLALIHDGKSSIGKVHRCLALDHVAALDPSRFLRSE